MGIKEDPHQCGTTTGHTTYEYVRLFGDAILSGNFYFYYLGSGSGGTCGGGVAHGIDNLTGVHGPVLHRRAAVLGFGGAPSVEEHHESGVGQYAHDQ